MNQPTALPPAVAPQSEPPPPFDHRVPCPTCNGTTIQYAGHPNDPATLEEPCPHCLDGTLDLDEAIDRGLT